MGDHAASMHIEYPMLFRVENKRAQRVSHCGVLEFIAQEGMVYMPQWVRVRERSCRTHATAQTLIVDYYADDGESALDSWRSGELEERVPA